MGAINLNNYKIHTDLIIEKNDLKHHEEIINGITISKSYKNGNYVTLSFDDVTDSINYSNVLKELEDVIREIIVNNKIDNSSSCLVVGLGNRLSTPDSLGVKVTDDVLVTRHLFCIDKVSPGYRNVSVISPGVMSSTGIETASIITSIIKEIKPDFVIAIDSLAALSIDRINKTIQITDTGIHPGSGIGNNRVEISKKTMGIPVIAIGVPTVVSSSVIVADTIEYLYKHISYLKDNNEINKLTYISSNYKNKIKNNKLTDNEKINLLGLFGSLSKNEGNSLINEVLNKTNLNYIVTPTEIDFIISKLGKLIANALNNSLHEIDSTN